MICFPNAKINLGLNIVQKRADGYHDIETVFYPVPVKDALEIVKADETTFSQTGIPVDAPADDNLVMKALNRMKRQFDLPPLEIHLLKAIPFGAGLGGGSSDAAFMLKLVNEFCSLALNDDELEEIAAGIGADCPFFIRNRPTFATGTGNLFTPVDLSLENYHLCLVKPDVWVSTRQAYASVHPCTPEIALTEIVKQPVAEWKTLMKNDFEESVISRYPVIGEIKDTLYARGALYASMSGSGSSVYGIFKDPVNMKNLFPSCFVWEGIL